MNNAQIIGICALAMYVSAWQKDRAWTFQLSKSKLNTLADEAGKSHVHQFIMRFAMFIPTKLNMYNFSIYVILNFTSKFVANKVENSTTRKKKIETIMMLADRNGDSPIAGVSLLAIIDLAVLIHVIVYFFCTAASYRVYFVRP